MSSLKDLLAGVDEKTSRWMENGTAVWFLKYREYGAQLSLKMYYNVWKTLGVHHFTWFIEVICVCINGDLGIKMRSCGQCAQKSMSIQEDIF